MASCGGRRYIISFIGKTVGKLTGAQSAANAASAAAATQAAAAQSGINNINPWMQAGNNALMQQQALMGLSGNQAQADAINALKSSSQFDALNAQGQEAILQNASATGGLRGGNTQAALAQFSPNLLNSLIQQQMSGLGGLSSQGLGAAGNVANLLTQQGAATAGGQIAQGSVASSGFNSLMQAAGTFAGMGGMPGIQKLF